MYGDHLPISRVFTVFLRTSFSAGLRRGVLFRDRLGPGSLTGDRIRLCSVALSIATTPPPSDLRGQCRPGLAPGCGRPEGLGGGWRPSGMHHDASTLRCGLCGLSALRIYENSGLTVCAQLVLIRPFQMGLPNMKFAWQVFRSLIAHVRFLRNLPPRLSRPGKVFSRLTEG